MKAVWRSRRFVMAAGVVAAIAAAAVPAPAPEPKPESTPTRPPTPRAAATRLAPGASAAAGEPHLNMLRLRRLLPAEAPPTDASTATPDVADAGDEGSDVEPPAVASSPNQEAEAGILDAFASKSWYVPPPPPPPPPAVKPPPPPKPTAPPLPFTYIGRFDNPGDPTLILLVRDDRLFTVSQGDTIDATYRVDRIDAGSVELTYLPLKQKQVLRTDGPG